MWIIHFESSGLDPQSYPIEVGLTDGKETFHAFIKPLMEWVYWSQESGQQHHISRDGLYKEGLDAIEVAKKINMLIQTDLVYCENIQWLQYLNLTLFTYVDIHPLFELRSIESLMMEHRKMTYYLEAKSELSSAKLYQHTSALTQAQIIHRAAKLMLNS